MARARFLNHVGRMNNAAERLDQCGRRRFDLLF